MSEENGRWSIITETKKNVKKREWKDITMNYMRNCPSCMEVIFYPNKKQQWQANKRNSLCWKCRNKSISDSKKGAKNPMYGKHFSDIAKEKQRLKKVGKPPYQMTDEIRKRIGLSSIGRSPWNKGKSGMQVAWNKGRKSTENEIRRNRIAQLKRLNRLGIPACIDNGAPKYFSTINSFGYNFTSKAFMDIGYVADGYDENLHVWIEFDTPYHNDVYHKKKDKIRQENIIHYFESINTPLNAFVRVKSDKNGNVLGTECVYGSFNQRI